MTNLYTLYEDDNCLYIYEFGICPEITYITYEIIGYCTAV